ncbi:MAG TPA: ABC transporter permease, partial [Candidatus Angelobacter sp.]
GGLTQVKETNRERRGLHQLEMFLQDLRYGFHALRKNPAFAAIAIVTLALGIGANTAVFQLLDAVRIRSLPVKDPRALVSIQPTTTKDRRGSVNRFGVLTYPLWEQIRAKENEFSGMFAWGENQFNLSSGGEAHYARAILASGDFFNVLGVSPLRGRLFSPADDQKGCGEPVAVLSYAFWQREFGGQPYVIGKKISLDSHPVEVIGVTPANFFGLEVGRSYDVAVPVCAEAVLRGEYSRLNSGTAWWLVGIARLKAGQSLERATALLESISPGIFQASLPPNYPPESVKSYLGFKLAAYPAAGGISQLRNDYSDSLWLLLGASTLILLIACANLANLMLARATARQREIAVRLALGASRARLLRQLMTEGLLLAVLGSVAALLLARGLSGFLIGLLNTEGDPISLDMSTNQHVLAFNAALAILTCILFGLTAALRATRTPPAAAMKSGNQSVTAGREWFGLQKILVVAQVSLSLALLAGALLFGRTLRNLLTVDAGFRQTGIAALSLDFARLHLPSDRRVNFKQQMLERLQAIPGIQAVSSTDIIPISGSSWSNGVWMEGSNSSEGPEVLFSRVSPDYFKTLDVPLVAGRTFNSHDDSAAPAVVIVNEAFARQLNGDANPVGLSFWRQQTPTSPQTLYQIVGLVRNTKYIDLREDFRPIAYLSAWQDPRPDTSDQVLLRSDLPLADLRSSVKSALAALSAQIDIDSDSFKNIVQSSLLRERLMATLSGFFGLLAALLATIGLYGVISYMVARRTNEIGIRMALGADRAKVARLIMGNAAILVLIGLAIGAVLTLFISNAAASLLYGLSPRDPLTLLAAAGLLAAVALVASHIPARRASRLDPLQALREE